MTPLTRIRSFATGMILLEWTYFVEAENVDERITMTPDCAKVRIGYYFDMQHIQKIAQKKSKSLDDVHLRIHVQSGGCSGLQYKFTMDYDKVYDYDKYDYS